MTITRLQRFERTRDFHNLGSPNRRPMVLVLENFPEASISITIGQARPALLCVVFYLFRAWRVNLHSPLFRLGHNNHLALYADIADDNLRQNKRADFLQSQS